MDKATIWSLIAAPLAYGIYWWFTKTRWQTRHNALWSIVTILVIGYVIAQGYNLITYGTISVPGSEPYPRY